MQQSGFVSVTELVGAMSDTFHLKPVDSEIGQHWIVIDIQDCGSKQSGVYVFQKPAANSAQITSFRHQNKAD